MRAATKPLFFVSKITFQQVTGKLNLRLNIAF
nr:MAG TPA: hypothetical protein [Caudoviricetes sp.]